jgi:uncharacterized protein (DUF488 family)
MTLKRSKPTLFTIGYAGLAVAQFLSALQAHAIETVVDVRELPLSRKSGFSKNVLKKHLARKQIHYSHVRELGCPRAIRARHPGRYRSEREWKLFEKAYPKYLAQQGLAVTALGELVTQSRSALLCVESDPKCCHRTTVTRAVAKRVPARVQDIVSGG